MNWERLARTALSPAARFLAIGAWIAMACWAQTPSPAKLVSSAEFRCLWWSQEQQAHFNPNQPPPKATEVLIDRWEYTDPVGTPNPDRINAHVTVRNDGGQASARFRLVTEIRWKTGPQTKPQSARWERRLLLKTVNTVGPVPAGGKVEFIVPIEIKPKMTALERRDWWPHEMELIVTGRALGTGRVLFATVRPFPIRPGD